MRTTFGILESDDGGKSWRWICEKVLGYDGQWDPPIAVTKDGRLWVGLDHGLASTVDGCLVDTESALDGHTVKDLTTDGTGEILYAITGKAGSPSAAWRRDKTGKWTRLAGSTAFETMNLMTIDVAPSDASRIYVSGQPYETIRGRLYVSKDGGKTFVGDANDQKADGPFFIGMVDKTEPDRLLVRHLHAEGSEVLFTTDAGKTWKNVLSIKSSMFGLAKSPTGNAIWAASAVDREGLFRSTDRGASFQHIAAKGVLCLLGTSDTQLFACENTSSLGRPVVGLSVNGGESWSPLSGFDKVLGPLACGDAAASLCESTWKDTEAILLPTNPADAGADAGSDTARPPKSKGCGCSVGLEDRVDTPWLISGLAPLLAWARTRRRRSFAQHVQGRS